MGKKKDTENYSNFGVDQHDAEEIVKRVHGNLSNDVNPLGYRFNKWSWNDFSSRKLKYF